MLHYLMILVMAFNLQLTSSMKTLYPAQRPAQQPQTNALQAKIRTDQLQREYEFKELQRAQLQREFEQLQRQQQMPER